jgi:hypothetical protein
VSENVGARNRRIRPEKQMARSLIVHSTWCWLLVGAAGCGGGVVPVKGTVKLDGKPLAGASIQFIAQDPGGRDATGSTDADGVFQLSSFRAGDGALPGKYKVVVQLPATSQGGAPAATPAEAQQGGTGGSKSPLTLPGRYSQPDQTTLEQIVPPTGEVVFDLQSK